MLMRFQETDLTVLKAGWVIGRGESKGERVELRVRACFQVKVEPIVVVVGNAAYATVSLLRSTSVDFIESLLRMV